MKKHNIWNLWKLKDTIEDQVFKLKNHTHKVDKLVSVTVESCKILLIFFSIVFNELHCKSKSYYYTNDFYLRVKHVGLMIDNVLVRNRTHHFSCQTRCHGNTWLVKVEEIFWVLHLLELLDCNRYVLIGSRCDSLQQLLRQEANHQHLSRLRTEKRWIKCCDVWLQTQCHCCVCILCETCWETWGFVHI